MSFQFEHSNSTWVRYREYEWKQAENGKLYLTACADAKPTIYDPLKEYQQLVLDALYIGRLGMKQDQDDTEIQAEIKAFAEKYGLFGLMTALPTTPSFMDYEAVYLPKNRFIKKETMSTEEYLALFFPFDKLDAVKRSVESLWNIEGDNMMMALAMTMSDRPLAVNMSFQRQYAESYEWMKQVFTDWAWCLPIGRLMPQQCFCITMTMISWTMTTNSLCGRVSVRLTVTLRAITLSCLNSLRLYGISIRSCLAYN